MVIACIINLLAVSTVFMTQSIFLELSQSFQIDVTQARFSFSIVSLFYCVSFFFLGPAADKFDLPKMAVIGLLLLGVAVLISAFATHFSVFIIGMACMGFSAAIIPASMFPHIARIAPQPEIGIYMGSIVASGTLGVILGRVAMGLLTAALGWQVSFWLVSLTIFLLAVLTYLYLVAGNDRRPVHSEQLTTLYLNSIRLLCNPRILALLLAGFCLFVGFLGMVTFLTYRLISPPFNFSSREVGWISFAGITALVAPFAGYLSQKIGLYRILFMSLLVCLVSFQLMGWFPSVALTTLALLLLFLGVYTFQPLLFMLIGRCSPQEALGSASSLYILFCIGGGSLSSIFLGPVWRSYGWPGVTMVCSLSLVVSLVLLSTTSVSEKGG